MHKKNLYNKMNFSRNIYVRREEKILKMMKYVYRNEYRMKKVS